MARQHWDSLSTQQKNELVAQAMGWKPNTPCEDGECNAYMGLYWLCSCGVSGDDWRDTEHCISAPNYLEDMTTAMKLVEQVKQEPLARIEFPAALRKYILANYVTINDEPINFMKTWIYCLSAEAICYAYLRTKRIIDKHGTVEEIESN